MSHHQHHQHHQHQHQAAMHAAPSHPLLVHLDAHSNREGPTKGKAARGVGKGSNSAPKGSSSAPSSPARPVDPKDGRASEGLL
jgi:hypothetical protein